MLLTLDTLLNFSPEGDDWSHNAFHQMIEMWFEMSPSGFKREAACWI